MAYNAARKALYGNGRSQQSNNQFSQQKICHQYARTGSCRFKNCRYLHVDNTKSQPAHSSNAVHTGTVTNGKSENWDVSPESDDLADFVIWRNDLPLKTTKLQPLGSRLGQFFTEARRLMKLDPGILQDVIFCFQQEAGRERIRELICQPFDKMSDSEKSTIFHSQAMPFIETISDRTVLTPMMLMTPVSTVYDHLFIDMGPNAIVPFLTLIVDTLARETGIDDLTKCKHLEAVFIVLSYAIENKSLKNIYEPMKTWLRKLGSLVDSFQSKISRAYHESLQERLAQLKRGFDAILESETTSPDEEDQKTTKLVPQRDQPGGRHDNDFSNIHDIKIMPSFNEIVSTYPEYLPRKDPRQWHIAGVAGLLDRNFRLLREDTVGQLRDTVKTIVQPSLVHECTNTQVKTRIYQKVRVISFNLLPIDGFQFQVVFEQPAQVRGSGREDHRQEWWELSKRLQPGSLVCICKAHGFAIFCRTVAHPKTNAQTSTSPDGSQAKAKTLWSDAREAYITLELVEFKRESVQSLLHQFRSQDVADSATLVEFPGILFQSFEPTLNALKRFSSRLDLPFSDLLAPSIADSHPDTASLPPPIYATSPGFSFELRCLMKDNSSLELRPGERFDLKTFQEKSVLDEAQAVALVDSLQRKIGLIQGPPGTGKSFTGVALIKVLLANKSKVQSGLGPIICVCYTNHALDQLLEDLLDHGLKNIVRIGSQSKSDRLQPFNLRILAQKTARTKAEKRQHYFAHKQFEENQYDFDKLRLNRLETEAHLMEHLRRNYPDRYNEIFGGPCDEWNPNPKPILDEPWLLLKEWLHSGKNSNVEPRSLEKLENVPLERMTNEERQMLWSHWESENNRDSDLQAISCIYEHFEAKGKFDRAKNEVNLRCLRNADIIGVTTSGLARNLHLLSCLEPKVVLCEEAGEVLEAHLLTTLLPSVEHLILIGDHLQLRPQIQNFQLSCEHTKGGVDYSLDVSLFERLVLPEQGHGIKLPYCTLETQRRMDPSIAELIRATLYPKLKDSPTVCLYPMVGGMRKRLFWLDHRKPEASNSTGETSHWNKHEIDMTHALVSHLVKQGMYESKDIAVLTPYLGQLHRLRQNLAGSFAIDLGEQDQKNLDIAGFTGDGMRPPASPEKTTLLQTLRAATIDNFQGEEAKVVVISLVRSNVENRCGFLRTANRINVLLSRAKHGMYIIGNSETSKHVPMWAKVINILQRDNNIGPTLELQCSRHPSTRMAVSEPNDFARVSPDGGCHLRCENRLSCGHPCPAKCHSDLMHAAVRCKVSVYDAKRVLPCGHFMQALPCWQARNLRSVHCQRCRLAAGTSNSHRTVNGAQIVNGGLGGGAIQDSMKKMHI